MEKTKRALEAVQHIYLCEDEGMASGQPTKEDYLEARKLVAAALSKLEGSKPKELTDMEIERIVRMPVNMISDHGEVWSEMSERQKSCVRLFLMYVRDHGYLYPQPKEPPRYVRSGPPVQMQDVLLACGELNERERVAVQWVLDKINELPERSKPSLMVGFSEEEEEADGWRYKTPHGWVVTKTKTSSDSQPLFANTRAVSIDQLMEVVTEWLTHDGREPDNTRQQPMPMSDLRERLMKIMP